MKERWVLNESLQDRMVRSACQCGTNSPTHDHFTVSWDEQLRDHWVAGLFDKLFSTEPSSI